MLSSQLRSNVPTGNKEDLTKTTGDELAYNCLGNASGSPLKGKDKEMRGYLCSSFIEGWDRARVVFSTETYCSPVMSFKDLSLVYLEYVISHKDVGKIPAAKALLIAFQDKWPCAREAKEGGSGPV